MPSHRLPSPVRRASLKLCLLAALALVVPLLALAGPAEAAGPRLSVPQATLRQSLVCQGVRHATREPVLLIPGTTLTAKTNFDWNYEPALTQRGIPWCAVTLPNHAMSDIQVSAEYVVAALRRMHRLSGRQTQVVGYSQGGMITRWALKYWPGTRALVDDVIGIDPSNHGTQSAYAVCTPACAPAFRQQTTGSHFLAALNHGPETWAGIDYTVVYTQTDEVVTPNLGPQASSELHTGKGTISNIAVQSICPVHLSDHLSMGSTDPVGWAVVLDALTHQGPAQSSRISPAVCLQDVMPGVDRTRLAANVARYGGEVATTAATYPRTTTEPPLKAYAR